MESASQSDCVLLPFCRGHRIASISCWRSNRERRRNAQIKNSNQIILHIIILDCASIDSAWNRIAMLRTEGERERALFGMNEMFELKTIHICSWKVIDSLRFSGKVLFDFDQWNPIYKRWHHSSRQKLEDCSTRKFHLLRIKFGSQWKQK